jgi:hypothetical protein
MWSLKRQSKGKELMDIDGGDDYDDDDDLDSELEDMAEKMLLGGSDLRHGRNTKTASLLRNLELEDSEDDTEDECGVDQLFDLIEDANFMPGGLLLQVNAKKFGVRYLLAILRKHTCSLWSGSRR